MGRAQQVTIGTDSPTNLVNSLFGGACTEVTNISVSSGEAVGSFDANGGAFPIPSGVVIRTGNVGFTAGPYTGLDLSSELNTNGDDYLQDLNDGQGRSALVTDVAFLEFEFEAESTNLNFEFLLASNEYGQWQCVSGDVLAFILTDLSTNTSQNLAVIPGTTAPISVQTIKDRTFNGTCPSVNADLFSTYEVDNAQSAINMRGYSKVLQAQSTVNPGGKYRIRIVIGDSNDSTFDSAIFLSSGSFNTGPELGADFSLCPSEERLVDSGLDEANYTFAWYRDNVQIPSQNGSTLLIESPGTYRVEATQPGKSCLLVDAVEAKALRINPVNDLANCFNDGLPQSYDLTTNGAAVLGVDTADFEVVYYASRVNRDNDLPIPLDQLQNFMGSGDQEIFLRLRNRETELICGPEASFFLRVEPRIALTTPADLSLCLLAGEVVEIDLSQLGTALLSRLDPDLFDLSYHASADDAGGNRNPILNVSEFSVSLATGSIPIFFRVSPKDRRACFIIESSVITINEKPVVDTVPDAMGCGFYELPQLTNGNYYSASGGTGTPYTAGSRIATGARIYIYTVSAAGCSNESSFQVFLSDEYMLSELDHCGSFTIPSTPGTIGAFYDGPGGSKGTADRLATGTEIVESQTIYYYSEFDGVVCQDTSYPINIIERPLVDDLDDVRTCDPFVLPKLMNGEYRDQPQGGGSIIPVGTTISTTQTIYIYSKDARCSNETVFTVFRAPTAADFPDRKVCGSYTLPTVLAGGFFPQAEGKGAPFAKGASITTSQRIYYYLPITEAGFNCTDDLSFQVTVTQTPPIDELPDARLCVGQSFILRPLVDGNYFTEPDGAGTRLRQGDMIKTSQTIYIYNLVNGCDNENKFNIEFVPLPKVDRFTPAFSCEAYELPELVNGNYFTLPNGKGDTLNAGDLIGQTTTLYIFNSLPEAPCTSESLFEINILGVDVGTFDDVSACDAYELPVLAKGDYFTEKRGKGIKYVGGELITATTTLYVYARNGARFICEDEEVFEITISTTPVLPPTRNIASCGEYGLPMLDTSVYSVGYFRQPGGIDPVPAEDLNINVAGVYTFYLYAQAFNNPSCTAENNFTVTITPRPDFTVPSGTICTDALTGAVLQPFILNSGLDATRFAVIWALDGLEVGRGTTFPATLPGLYTATTQKLIPEDGRDCNYNPASVEVFSSSVPVIASTVSQPFEDIAVVTIEVTSGAGDYGYSIDGGPYGESNEFYDVAVGMHVITVKGSTGACGVATTRVNVVKFPKYFTPNADGFNDTWNITSISQYDQAQVQVFDRHGKLLGVLDPDGRGWDGTYNGENLPSSDYWFVVSFIYEGEPVTFKSHFTLKR